jgi:hypothetical protein
MDKCNLCYKNNADKKGSHIVPHFLLKRIENIEGKTGRDYGIGYKIERLNAKSHFGRSIQPERLEETYGEITDDDIANNIHPLIVDNFLCSHCEERLAQIENKYSLTIESVEETVYESGINNLNGILFWASVFWRMSVYGESGVRLSAEQNESLRNILDSFLPKKNNKLNEEAFANSDLIKDVAYKIIRCHNSEKNDAKWLVFHPDFYNSFCLFIAEFVVVLSLNGEFEEFNTIDCFGINEIILKAPTNYSNGNEIIQPIDRSIYNRYGQKIVNKIKEVYVGGLFEFLDEIHIAAGGKGDKMPFDIKQEIMEEITSDEKKIGRKYTQKEIIMSAYIVMQKYVSNN